MKKADLIREVANRIRSDARNAADQVDRAVNSIVRSLREGKPVRIPGFGTLNPGKIWTFKSDKAQRNDS
jgi:nucleoid DNA-binding protein